MFQLKIQSQRYRYSYITGGSSFLLNMYEYCTIIWVWVSCLYKYWKFNINYRHQNKTIKNNKHQNSLCMCILFLFIPVVCKFSLQMAAYSIRQKIRRAYYREGSLWSVITDHLIHHHQHPPMCQNTSHWIWNKFIHSKFELLLSVVCPIAQKHFWPIRCFWFKGSGVFTPYSKFIAEKIICSKQQIHSLLLAGQWPGRAALVLFCLVQTITFFDQMCRYCSKLFNIGSYLTCNKNSKSLT